LAHITHIIKQQVKMTFFCYYAIRLINGIFMCVHVLQYCSTRKISISQVVSSAYAFKQFGLAFCSWVNY